MKLGIEIINTSSTSLTLVVEPWADEFEIPGGQRGKLELHDDETRTEHQKEIQIECESDLSLYAWPGSNYSFALG